MEFMYNNATCTAYRDFQLTLLFQRKALLHTTYCACSYTKPEEIYNIKATYTTHCFLVALSRKSDSAKVSISEFSQIKMYLIIYICNLLTKTKSLSFCWHYSQSLSCSSIQHNMLNLLSQHLIWLKNEKNWKLSVIGNTYIT